MESVLIVEPSQIRFRGPFNRPVSSVISLINPSDRKIIFKIKTSAPTFYGVRPNFGVVQPQNFVEVEIARQPFNYDPKEKICHRFLIESLAAPNDIEDVNTFWKTADPTQLSTTKLRCVFELPKSESQAQELAVQQKSSQSQAQSQAQNTKPKDTQMGEPISTVRLVSGSNSLSQKKTELKHFTELNIKDSILQQQIDTMTFEIRKLRYENTNLIRENATLKIEIKAIRNSKPSKTEEKNVKPIIIKETKSFPFFYILSSITLVLVCILIGKFFL